MSELAFKLFFIGIMKCAFSHESPEDIFKCQEKVYKQTYRETDFKGCKLNE